MITRRPQVVGLVVPFGPSADTAGLLPFLETIASCARAEDHDVLLVTADEGAALGHDRVVLIGHPGEVIDRDLNYVRRFQPPGRGPVRRAPRRPARPWNAHWTRAVVPG